MQQILGVVANINKVKQIIKRRDEMKLTTEEQELCINAERVSDIATAYISDNTWITKMDKLVIKNPKEFKCIAETEWGKTYSFPKKYISIRVSSRSMSDEQREAASKRFTKMHLDRQLQSNI